MRNPQLYSSYRKRQKDNSQIDDVKQSKLDSHNKAHIEFLLSLDKEERKKFIPPRVKAPTKNYRKSPRPREESEEDKKRARLASIKASEEFGDPVDIFEF